MFLSVRPFFFKMVITNNLDFDIFDEDMNPRTIVIIDKSSYIEEFPESPMMEILPPGHSRWMRLPFKVKDTNVITSGQLNLTCGEVTTLPDGVYRFSLSVCPNDKVFLCKNHLRTTCIEYDMHSLILKVLDKCDPESDKIKKKLMDVDCLLTGGKASARLGNIKKAGELYQKASSIISNLNKKCN